MGHEGMVKGRTDWHCQLRLLRLAAFSAVAAADITKLQQERGVALTDIVRELHP
jgi:hypothetical protein